MLPYIIMALGVIWFVAFSIVRHMQIRELIREGQAKTYIEAQCSTAWLRSKTRRGRILKGIVLAYIFSFVAVVITVGLLSIFFHDKPSSTRRDGHYNALQSIQPSGM